MATIDNIRNELIDKTLPIQNKKILEALDNLIVSSSYFTEQVELSN